MDRSKQSFASGLVAFLLLCFATLTHAASPQLNIIQPRGWQRGTEVEVHFQGARLSDAQEVFYYEPGISTVKIEPVENNPNAVKVRFKIEPTCRLGTHILRIRTAGGISEARTFNVGQYPVVDEKEPNNDFTAPQAIALNTTVHGVADNEDIDYYILDAKKGQRITAEVEGMRLGSALFDPAVAIMDMKRFELDASDDTALALQDPIASVIAPEDGKYVIMVRESSYAGNGGCVYRLHVGEAPRPVAVYPAGGKAGDEIEAKLIGDVAGLVTAKIKLPAAPGEFRYYFEQNGQSAPSPNPLRVSAYANVLEVEPNNDVATATKTDSEIPLAFNGIIEKAGDIDFFRFKAKAGQQFDVRCVAKGIRSPLDSVMILYNGAGQQLAANDDSGGPDSYFRWGVPADGEYVVAVHDHLGKGGADYVYRIEFDPVKAGLSLNIPEFARNSQERNTIFVPRGNRFATLIRVNRINVGGDVTLALPELPAGVTAAFDAVAGNVNEVPVVFEAAADAPMAGKLIPLLAAHATDKAVTGGFVQNLELIYGPPNNTVFFRGTVDRVAMSVDEEAPFMISIVEPKVPLVQNGAMGVKVVAERKPGFDKPITVRMLWNPPGFGTANEVTIAPGQKEVDYAFNANGGAPVRPWKIAMLGVSDEGKGPVWASTQLATINVAAPYVGMTIDMVAGEQGKSADIVCKLTVATPFEGKAKVLIHGLPPKVTLQQAEMEVTKDAKEVVFHAAVAADAPVGQHKTMFAQVIVPLNGELMYHNRAGASVFRIDAPPPPKPNAPPPAPVAQAAPMPAAPAAPAPPPEKRLTRLEKLRLEAEERAKQEAAQKK